MCSAQIENSAHRNMSKVLKSKLTWRTPTKGEEGTSPNTWIETVDMAIESGRKLGLTLCRHT